MGQIERTPVKGVEFRRAPTAEHEMTAQRMAETIGKIAEVNGHIARMHEKLTRTYGSDYLRQEADALLQETSATMDEIDQEYKAKLLAVISTNLEAMGPDFLGKDGYASYQALESRQLEAIPESVLTQLASQFDA